MFDGIIIGAGVTGCAVAEKLGRYRGNWLVLEAGEDVATGASKANSGIVHAGFDAEPGSRKAYFNVRGARMYPSEAKRLGVPYKRNGAFVVAFDEDEKARLAALLEQGVKNGVSGLRLLTGDQAREKEPKLSPAVTACLEAADSAVVSPYEMTLAYAYHAAQCGVRFLFNRRVTGIVCRPDGVFTVRAEKESWQTRAVINCAGCGADRVRAMLSDQAIRIIPRRGEYYLFDMAAGSPVERTIFQAPGKMGKGVLVTPTVHGNLLIGPSAEDIPDASDTRTTAEGLAFVREKAFRSCADLPMNRVITTFAGVRAHEAGGDFLVGPVPGGAPGAFEAAGIESPGLSSAPAIAEELGELAAGYLKCEAKEQVPAPVPLLKPFAEMDSEEKQAAWEKDPAYGNIICRCEQITEAEILDAIRRPVGARSLDGVKRRTRASMGRCQGGFCTPRILELLCRHAGLEPLQVTKCGGESRVLTGTICREQEEGKDDAE